MIPPRFPQHDTSGCSSARTWRLALACAAAAAALTGCRQKMADQPSYRPLQESEFFVNAPVMPGAASRPLVENTVFRGGLRDDAALFTGKVASTDPAATETVTLVNEFPISITEEVIKRGQARYNIYCTPCHGYLGDGNGMIVQRGLVGPANFHSDRLTTAPVGHFFDVITNGFGRMVSMDQIPVRDRWAIIAYIKALQLSQRATLQDVPEAERATLLAAATTPTTATVTAGAAPAQNNTSGGAH